MKCFLLPKCYQEGVDKPPTEDSAEERFDSQPIVTNEAINGEAESRAQDVEQVLI